MAAPKPTEVWVFQAVPSVYEILEQVPARLHRSGASDSWLVSRYWKEMKDGQRVILWRSGRCAGIYGTATIVGTWYRHGKFRVIDLKFDPLLQHPLLRRQLLGHPVLKKLSVVRIARGTNFRVTPKEWAVLRTMLRVRQTPSQRDAAVEQNRLPPFNPKGLRDARRRMMRSIVQRQGQPEFRRRLLDIYGRRCLLSGCNAEDALEAAHICPYKGSRTNHPENGILLRADLHTLFDLHLITIDAERRVRIAPGLRGTPYAKFNRRKLKFPLNGPSEKALLRHWKEFLKEVGAVK